MMSLNGTGRLNFSNIHIKPSPEGKKMWKWLMDNRDLIEFCMDTRLPIPRYQSLTNHEEKT